MIHSTDFDLVETSTYSWPHASKVDAANLGSTNTYGVTTTHKGTSGGNPYFYKVIWLNTHEHLNYNTRGSCNIFASDVPVQYILNHEFGHLAGLNHHHHFTWTSDHTAMKPGCDSGMAQLRAEDINDINDYYS